MLIVFSLRSVNTNRLSDQYMVYKANGYSAVDEGVYCIRRTSNSFLGAHDILSKGERFVYYFSFDLHQLTSYLRK